MLTWNPADPTETALLKNRPESPAANQAFKDFILLGSGRNLPRLLEWYKNRPETPPTRSYDTLRKWSVSYDWPARAARIDLLEDKRARNELKLRRDKLLESGLALSHERVDLLTALSEKISQLVASDEALWVTTVKSVDLGGDLRERVVQRKFNGAAIRHLRGLLKDIAQEASGRYSAGHEIAPTVDFPLDPDDEYVFKELPYPERLEFIRLFNKAFPHARHITRPDPQEFDAQ